MKKFNLDEMLEIDYERYDPLTQDHYSTKEISHRTEFEPEYIDPFDMDKEKQSCKTAKQK